MKRTILRDSQKRIREMHSTRQFIQHWDILCPSCGSVVNQIVTVIYNPRTILADYATRPKPSLHLHCANCATDFQWRRVSIRAKNSRGAKKQDTREFSVRVLEHDGLEYRNEALIQFTSNGYADFELRSGDQAAFCYLVGDLALVQNLTIGIALTLRSGQQSPAPKFSSEVVEMQEPKERNCYLATYIYGKNSAEVTLLRQFRDEVLLNYSLLAGTVSLYYFISPQLVRRFGNSKVFRYVVKTSLNPVVRCIAKYYPSKRLMYRES